MKENSNEKVNHPSHYTWLKEKCGIEVIDITRHFNFSIGNALKYLLRHGHKSEEGYNDDEKAIEDLKKAKWYIQDEINTLSGNKEQDYETLYNNEKRIKEDLIKQRSELFDTIESLKAGTNPIKLSVSELLTLIKNIGKKDRMITLRNYSAGIGIGIIASIENDKKEIRQIDITDIDLW